LIREKSHINQQVINYERKILAYDAASEDRFGISVSVHEDYLVVGGGGAGGNRTVDGGDGSVNTGSGGGGNGKVSPTANNGAGGSGVVILKYPDTYTATFSIGVVQSTSTSGGFKVSTITAAGALDTVSWA
jgi:hypothetical protein